jgi:hypothetical protein
MGTTGDPDRPVTEPDRITLSPARAGTRGVPKKKNKKGHWDKENPKSSKCKNC